MVPPPLAQVRELERQVIEISPTRAHLDLSGILLEEGEWREEEEKIKKKQRKKKLREETEEEMEAPSRLPAKDGEVFEAALEASDVVPAMLPVVASAKEEPEEKMKEEEKEEKQNKKKKKEKLFKGRTYRGKSSTPLMDEKEYEEQEEEEEEEDEEEKEEEQPESDKKVAEKATKPVCKGKKRTGKTKEKSGKRPELARYDVRRVLDAKRQGQESGQERQGGG